MTEFRNSKKNAAEIFASSYVDNQLSALRALATPTTSTNLPAVTTTPATLIPGLNLQAVNPVLLIGGGAAVLVLLLLLSKR